MTPENQTIWTGCYNDGWKDIITPESFAHPAKMAYGLLKRILAHAAAEGWISPGQVIVDPFGGIDSTGILGAYEGYQVIGVELEQRFVDLAGENIKLHAHILKGLGCPIPVILQGDSRKLCEVVSAADCVVSSPPFQGCITADSKTFTPYTGPGKYVYSKETAARRKTGYGQSPGQLGSMKPGAIDCVLSSPPYAETLKGDGTQSETASESRAKRNTPGGSLGQSQRTQGYGSEGNLGNLKPGQVAAVISSPPYSEGLTQGGGQRTEPTNSGAGGNIPPRHYGQTPGNLGNLKPGNVSAIISSPPFEDSLAHKMTDGSLAAAGKNKDGSNRGGSLVGTDYGDAEGNIGNDKGDTFWQAALEIVQQCHQILKPGGHAIWVVKSFVRKGKRVDFPGDWRRLCESVGLKTVCEHHAMLVKETRTDGLFGEIVEKKERKSFFRRLAEAKGSPPIDYEVVICGVKE